MLRAPGFVVAPHRATRHRKWRGVSRARNSAMIAFVDKGIGTLEPYLILDLVGQLRGNGMITTEFDEA
jgi:hypothetical protein